MAKVDTAETELATLFEKAGLTLPEDRRAAVLHGYRELRTMAESLRAADLTAVDEPSNIYGFDPILRGGQS
ncbi:MAG: hypothetical protein AAGI50_00715 [Pseudomonadota bacterium]